jgi:glucoamylase
LHWTSDDWQDSKDTRSQGTAIGIEFVDIPLPDRQENVIRFTFLWMEENRWEGRDYTVNVRQEDAAAKSRRNLRRRKAPGQHAPTVG